MVTTKKLRRGSKRRKRVYVHPHMVVIYVIKLLVVKHIKLNAKDMVVGITIVGIVKEAKMLSRIHPSGACRRCQYEDKAMAREKVFEGCNGENE